jgi:hypothetical protein
MTGTGGRLIPIVTVILIFGGFESKAAPICTPNMDPVKCAEAQLADSAALLGQFKSEIARLETEIATLRSQSLAPRQTIVVPGNRVRCDLAWSDASDNNASVATCPADYTLLSGGCDMTCLSMDHLSSMPNPPGPNSNGWKCRHAPQPGPMLTSDTRDNRTHSALALCQKKPSP